MFGSNWSIQLWHPYARAILCLATITVISSLYCINNLYYKEYIILTVAKSTANGPHADKDAALLATATPVPEGYLVYNSKCRIPDFGAFTAEVEPFIKKKFYKKCAKNDPLTYVEKLDGFSLLHIDENMRSAYAPNDDLTCCYSVVTRHPELDQQNPDNAYLITDCQKFRNSTVLNSTVEFIIVRCSYAKGKAMKEVYANAHSLVPVKREVKKRLNTFKNKTGDEQALSVVFIGIDSISRLNLYRSMPLTAGYLNNRGWIELRGYNKMGDNTYPNLMAIFTGYNLSLSYKICKPTEVNNLDKCPLIFYKFRELGFATAYAEDEPTMSTFNFRKVGFNVQPTDYYIRPYLLAAEKALPIKTVSGLNYCVGPVTSGERILDYAYQFLDTYKSDPYFGFFWMNSFSHNEVNAPSMMDFKIKQWFERVEETGVFNTSMVVFLSDHGMRFGSIRETNSGWLEERLPFIHIWLPQWFQNKFPAAVSNLIQNSNRFTTPYDLHMTVQDVLVKSGRLDRPIPSKSCPSCRSLFEKAEFNRTCDDAGVELHWCTCYGFRNTDKRKTIVKQAALALVSEIKRILERNSISKSLCLMPKLRNIIDARKSTFYNKDQTLYLLVIEMSKSSAKFEASIMHSRSNNSDHFDLKGDISRINMYAKESSCINDSYLKKYCFCKKSIKS